MPRCSRPSWPPSAAASSAMHRSVPKLGPCKRPSPWVWNPASNLLGVRGRRPTKAREFNSKLLVYFMHFPITGHYVPLSPPWADLQEPNAARKQQRPAQSALASWSTARVALSLDLCRARGGRTPEEPLGAEILIDVRPMDAVAATRDAPVLPLGRGGVEQARIPGQRDRDGPPVPQGDAEGILGELHVGDTLVSRQRQDAHAKPPRMPLHVRRPVFESAATPWARTRSSARARPAATRTWPRDRPDRHGYAAAHAARGCRSKSGKDRSARQSA